MELQVYVYKFVANSNNLFYYKKQELASLPPNFIWIFIYEMLALKQAFEIFKILPWKFSIYLQV